MTYLQKATQLYQMIGSGRLLDAFEQFYAEDIVMVEASGEVREGKATNRVFEQQFMGGIQEMHGGGARAITANEEDAVTMVESWMEVTFKDGNRVFMEQIAVQYWEGDLIKREKFYYNPSPTGS